MDLNNLGLFDFFKKFFEKNDDWYKIPNKIKEKHAYMLMQFLAIKLPDMMHILNKEHSVIIIDLLHEINKVYGKSPGWMYTKAVQTQKSEEKLDLKKYPKDYIKLYKEIQNFNEKDMNDLCEMFPKELDNYFKDQLKGYEQKTK